LLDCVAEHSNHAKYIQDTDLFFVLLKYLEVFIIVVDDLVEIMKAKKHTTINITYHNDSLHNTMEYSGGVKHVQDIDWFL